MGHTRNRASPLATASSRHKYSQLAVTNGNQSQLDNEPSWDTAQLFDR
jgi:hypothetical protein